MNLEDLFDRLQELFEESWRMPLSNGKAVVDVLEATELVRELRSNLPVELEQARRIVEERKEIVHGAPRGRGDAQKRRGKGKIHDVARGNRGGGQPRGQ